jgi:phosphomannomutase
LLLNILVRRQKSLSELIAPLKGRYWQAPETNLDVRDKEAAMSAVERKYAHGRIEKIDGLSVSFHDYWFNIRPSNTEPVLRLRLEAKEKEVADARLKELIEVVSDK